MRINKSFLGLLPIFVLLGLILPVHAQEPEPLITDRPDFTESPQTVDPGRVQAEFGATHTRAGDGRDTTYGELLVRVPVSSKSEVRFGVPSYIRARATGSKASGWDDAVLGYKYALSPGGNGKPAAAVLLSSVVPTGSRSVSERRYQPEAKLLLGWDLAENIGLGVNLGVGRPTDGGQRFTQVIGSASLGFGLSEKWGVFTEVFGFTKTDATGNGTKYFDAGVTYLVNPDLQLDARVGQGLNNNVSGPDYFVGVGASKRF